MYTDPKLSIATSVGETKPASTWIEGVVTVSYPATAVQSVLPAFGDELEESRSSERGVDLLNWMNYHAY